METGIRERLIKRKVSFHETPILACEPHPHTTLSCSNLHGSFLKPQDSRGSIRVSQSGRLLDDATSLSADSGRKGYWRRWISISVVCFINFLLSAQIFLYLSTLWPYLSSIDPGATAEFFGVIVLFTNLAATLGNPIFGYWSSRTQQCRAPIVGGIIIMTISGFVLACVEMFPVPYRKWVILVVRTVAGFSYGNSSVISAYVAMASTEEERAKAMTFRSGSSAVGKALGPALQIIFVPLGYPGIVRGWFHLDMYTAAALANALIGIIQIILMCVLFKEDWVGVESEQSKSVSDEKIDKVDFKNTPSYNSNIKTKKVVPVEKARLSYIEEIEQEESETEQDEKPGKEADVAPVRSYDLVAVCALIYTRFIFQFCTVTILTIGSPYTMLMFGWSAIEAVTYNGYISLGSGIFEILLCLLLATFVLKFVSEKTSMVIGFVCLIIFYLITFSWPELPPLVDVSTDNVHGECTHPWCSYTTRIYLSQYLVGYAFFVTSMCLFFIGNSSLFSKLVEARQQSLFQGYYMTSGQVALTINPIVATSLLHFEGPRVAWAVCGALLLTAALVMGVCWRRIVPRSERIPVFE